MVVVNNGWSTCALVIFKTLVTAAELLNDRAQALEVPDSTPVLLKLRPLKAGDSFSIEGRINEDANKVDFNLYSSANPKQNVLHVNPRFYQNTTVINSYLDGHWGEEELAPLVFRRGESFTLEVNDTTLPLEMGFPGGSLKTNQSIILYGIPRGDRWTLELPGDDGDILFHFKALFKANAVRH
nr:Galectin domain containing protein [Haemonchus contortus]